MWHRTNWGAVVGGLVLLAIAGLFLADTLTPLALPLITIVPLLLGGLGLAALLGRRHERTAAARALAEQDEPHGP
ncbi:MAG TPA: hypothetical protein VF053_03865 [Streptosporangiales bacterium]